MRCRYHRHRSVAWRHEGRGTSTTTNSGVCLRRLTGMATRAGRSRHQLTPMNIFSCHKNGWWLRRRSCQPRICWNSSEEVCRAVHLDVWMIFVDWLIELRKVLHPTQRHKIGSFWARLPSQDLVAIWYRGRDNLHSSPLAVVTSWLGTETPADAAVAGTVVGRGSRRRSWRRSWWWWWGCRRGRSACTANTSTLSRRPRCSTGSVHTYAVPVTDNSHRPIRRNSADELTHVGRCELAIGTTPYTAGSFSSSVMYESGLCQLSPNRPKIGCRSSNVSWAIAKQMADRLSVAYAQRSTSPVNFGEH